jgi:predicted nucleic acid-binding protein
VYLADTNVISHSAPKAKPPKAGMTEWLRRNGRHVWISVVTLAELAYGAADLGRRGAHRRAEALHRWIEDVVALHADRILPVDPATALRAGELLARAVGQGRDPGMEDALIAATADLRGLTVLTRNLTDFEPMGVRATDPFRRLPPDAAAGAD